MIPTEPRSDPSRRAWPIFALAILIGIGGLVPFALQAYRDIRITWFYKPATCKIIASSLYTTSTRAFRVVGVSSSHPEFTYQLQVGGRWYTAVGFDNMGGRDAHPGEVDQFKRGESFPCWYDPWNPSQAVLRKQAYKPFYWGVLIPAFFLVVGTNMLTRSLRPSPSVKLEGAERGEALAVRLSPELSGSGAVGCIGAAAVAWTAGLAAFVAYLFRTTDSVSDGQITIAVAIAGIDAFLIFHLIRSLRALSLPEPVVEISHEPLRPGDSARLFIRQRGPARFDAFTVSVLCEEQGQKGLIQSHRRQLVKQKGADIAAAANLDETVTVEVPADARLSVRELQTIIRWKIVVHRQGKFGTADREFVFRVLDGPSQQPRPA